LIARWSWSTKLLRYFDLRASTTASESICTLATAAVFDPLLLMVILSGKPCSEMARSSKRPATASPERTQQVVDRCAVDVHGGVKALPSG
jgi:hypothetical protein